MIHHSHHSNRMACHFIEAAMFLLFAGALHVNLDDLLVIGSHLLFARDALVFFLGKSFERIHEVFIFRECIFQFRVELAD